MTPPSRAATVAASIAAALVLATAAAAQGVSISLVPATLALAPDSVFTLELRVTQAGTAFNAFDATVGFDTSAVQLQPMSPLSQQQGALMTAACGNTFHFFQYAAGVDSMNVSLSLLCANTALAGPGQIYRLRFKAVHTPHVGWIRIRRAVFYDAGIIVSPQPNPLVTADAFLTVGNVTAVPPAPVAAHAPRVRAGPDPAFGPLVLRLEGRSRGAARIEIRDALGRVVRRMTAADGAAVAGWDGRDDQGRALPAGLYLIRWSAAGTEARGRVTLLR